MTHGHCGGFHHHHAGFHHHHGQHHGHHHAHGHQHHRHGGMWNQRHHFGAPFIGATISAATAVAVTTPVKREVAISTIQVEKALGIQSVTLPPVPSVVNGITYFAIDVVPESGHSWRILKRYNDFLRLAQSLRFLHQFPRKHLTGCVGSKLEKRRLLLEAWLTKALQHQEMRPHMRPFLREFLCAYSPQAATLQTPLPAPSTPTTSAQVPELRRDPEGWFKHFDKSGKGWLDTSAVIDALLTTFPEADPSTVQEFITDLWMELSLDISDTISIAEFLQRRGLREAILAQIDLSPSAPPAQEGLAGLVTLEVKIPSGVQGGDPLNITVPDGRQALITVPGGYAAGMALQFVFNPEGGELGLLA